MRTSVRIHAVMWVLVLTGCFCVAPGYAQQTSGLPADTSSIPRVLDVIRAAKEPGIRFSARDSLSFSLRGQKVANLFGAAKVEHKEGTLESGLVSLNLDRNEMSASSPSSDTLSQPILRRGSQEVRSKAIQFNYASGKGRFEVARLGIEQGKIRAEQVKNVTPHVIFLEDAMYSTCELDHPHYYIRVSRMKIVDQEKMFFTRGRLYFLDIPYPLVFPYGYFPGSFSQQQSGLLPVVYSYQQQQERGLGLQNLGWFQYINDHLTGSVALDLFTSGTFYARSQFRYAKTDKLSGTINLGYSVDQGMESTDPDFSKRRQNRFNMQHNQRFSPYSTLTADVTLQTSEFMRRNSLNIDDRAEVATNSYLNFRYNHPEQRFTFNADIRQNQNFRNNVTTISGPSASFSLRTISPFQKKGRSSARGAWYESLNVSYSNRLQTSYRFVPTDADSAEVNWFEALLDPRLYREATGADRHVDFGIRQDAGANVQLAGGEAVQLSANLNLTQIAVPYTTERYVNPDSNRTRNVSRRDPGVFHDGSLALNLSSRFYGISNMKIGNLTSFRHTISPGLSFSFRPDFGNAFWGYFVRPIDERTGLPYAPVDSLSGTVLDNRYNRFDGNVFGTTPSRGMSRMLSLSIGNVFEAKQTRRDTTGERKEQIIRLIDNLNLSTSYNFAADSYHLSPLRATFSSSLIQSVNISANAAFDFYGTDETGTRVDKLLWLSDRRPFRLTSFSLNSGTRFAKGQQFRAATALPYFPRYYDPFDQSIFSPFDPLFNRIPVEDFNVPWSVSINFSYNWNRTMQNRITRNAILQASNIQVQLTPNWNMSTRLGYDFIRHKLTPAEFALSRKLHCWDLSFQWNPFGDFKYYFFSLKLDAGHLQGILQKLPGLNMLDQGSSRVRNARSGNSFY